MPECVHSKCRLFADGSIIYSTVNSEHDAINLQSDVDALQKWEKDYWGMSFKPTKCNVIHITRKKHPIHHVYALKGIPLKAVNEASYLDVIVSKDLVWHKQTAKVVVNGNKTLDFVERNIKTPFQDTKKKHTEPLFNPQWNMH